MSKLNFLKSFYWYDRFALSQMSTSILSFNLPEDLNKWTPNSNSQFTCVSWFTYEQIQNCKIWNYFPLQVTNPRCITSVGNYIFKVNNINTKTKSEICSKSTIKTPEWCQWHRSGVFNVNFKHIPHLVLVFLLLTLSR